MTHREKIQIIAEKISMAAHNKQKIVFAKKSTSHTVPNVKRGKQNESVKINVGNLTQIISIDRNEKTCTVESGITFQNLVAEILPLGFAPYVVPELKGITAGGAVSGCSIESMSYRYGGFHDSCLEYEIIDATGKIHTISRENDPELFEMIHGSYGTLGFLSKIKCKLYPAKPFVKMTYEKFDNFDDFYRSLMDHCARADYTFIDAIIHDPKKLVICLGEYADTAPYESNYEKEKIFYKSTAELNEDYIRTKQYFFRYDTECHWLSRAIPILEWKTARKFLGKFFLGSENMIRWSRRFTDISLPVQAGKLPPVRAAEKFLHYKNRPRVIVDVLIPNKNFPEFWKWYEKDFDFFPLWIVPYKMPRGAYPWVNPEHVAKTGEDFYIDAAVYGKKNTILEIDYSQLIEDETFKLGGIKTLISKNNYTPERFAEIYNLELYNRVKQKTDPDNLFGTVFEKLVK